MRVGLVGLGDAGRHHARALGAMASAGEITWAAACGRDVERARRFCEAEGAPAGVSVEYRSAPRLSLVGTAGEVECVGTLGARGAGQIVQRSPRGESTPLPFTRPIPTSPSSETSWRAP